MKTVFELKLPALLCFVKESCHDNLRMTMQRLQELNLEAKTEPSLRNFLHQFLEELQRHLEHEERSVYPFIASGEGRTKAANIPHLVDDHDQLRLSLMKIRRMTRYYAVPEGLDPTTANFYETLRELDRIILNHIQLEDNVLFPMVLNTDPQL